MVELYHSGLPYMGGPAKAPPLTQCESRVLTAAKAIMALHDSHYVSFGIILDYFAVRNWRSETIRYSITMLIQRGRLFEIEIGVSGIKIYSTIEWNKTSYNRKICFHSKELREVRRA